MTSVSFFMERFTAFVLFLLLSTITIHLANASSSSSSSPSSLWSFPPGTTAVVTGGTKGIGKAIVDELLAYSSSGNNDNDDHQTLHILTCARNAQDLHQCLKEWNNGNQQQDQQRVHGVVADVSTAQGRDALVQEIKAWLRSIQQPNNENNDDDKLSLDLLINNVGTNIRKPSVDYNDEEIDFLLQTNLRSMIQLTTSLHPYLKCKKQPSTSSTSLPTASVVNIGSVAGETCIKTGTIYAATKAAMNQLTGNWACEWGLPPPNDDDETRGIRVNCISPWYIETELAQQVLKNKDYRQAVLSQTPMGRTGKPAEVAAAVVFLCLPAAGYITGQVLSVDGGFVRNGFYDSFYRE